MTAFKDLIFVSMEPWDEIWRRNQFLCSAYARRFTGNKILFVSPPLDVSNHMCRGRMPDTQRLAAFSPPDHPNITVTRPLKLFPNTLTTGRLLNEAMIRRHVASMTHELGLRDPILWLNPHTAVHMAGRMAESAVIYDITDDWISLTQSCRMKKLTAAQDLALCRRADAVIVCSPHLYKLKSSLTQNLHLIPNGVNLDHYQGILDSAGPVPRGADQWTRPVLGYTGTIHPDRVDVGLVESVAARMPDATVVLVGPNHLPAATMARLRMLPNLVLVGAVPYQEIPNYMRAFDICITPHLITPFTESLNPIKLWEYLASGKPIVSTDVAGFRDFPHLVRITDGPDQFAAAARSAICEESGRAQARIEEAARHRWVSRLDNVVSVIGGLKTGAG